MAGSSKRSRGSARGAGGGVALAARQRLGGPSPSSTIAADPGTRSFRRLANSPYGAGGRSERLMAAAGRMSRSMMSNDRGTGLRTRVAGDFYRPGTGNKFNGSATRSGSRVTVRERDYRTGRPTGQSYRYRLTDKPGARPVGARTVRRRLQNR